MVKENLFKRLLNPISGHSFFLFGARGTGKSTWLRRHYKKEKVLFLDFLDVDLFERILLDIKKFDQLIEQSSSQLVIIDEVQKLPKILDRVHYYIENENRQFILTGSSSRRLKQKGVNLLAGRAFLYNLYPLSLSEIGFNFDLFNVLQFGLLPGIFQFKENQAKIEFLKSYVRLYVEKEVQLEGWVRKIEPFRKFLTIAAQMNGKIINRAKIAKDVGVDNTTIASYFEILEDTLVGFTLPAFHTSVRKSVKQAPKFYFIDPGINRSLLGLTANEVVPRTQEFGELFEQVIILEIHKLANYNRYDFQFFYLRSKNDVEIDLIIQRPAQPLILIEIKSKDKIGENDLKSLKTLGNDLDSQAIKLLLSRDSMTQKYGDIYCLYYQDFLKEFNSWMTDARHS